MHIETKYHGLASCVIDFDEPEERYIGTLKYKDYENGTVYGPSIDSVKTQFYAICRMLDAGGMLREGTIMLGYHNGDFHGDVLLVDGEIIGEWTSDELEWCYFTAVDDDESTCAAPSPWMLQDAIIQWVKSKV